MGGIVGKNASAAKRKAKKLQKADADGTTRYKVSVTYAYQENWIVKAINEQQAAQRVEEGFGTNAGTKAPQVVDIAVLDMSMAETKGHITEEEGGKGLIEVVKG